MNEVKQISVAEARALLKNENAVFLDIRDVGSYQRKHVGGAIHIHNANVEEFLSNADKNKPTIVYCYHGISSLGAAGYFQERGFTNVLSLIGGYEAWESGS